MALNWTADEQMDQLPVQSELDNPESKQPHLEQRTAFVPNQSSAIASNNQYEKKKTFHKN
jgi:hypothetical protein